MCVDVSVGGCAGHIVHAERGVVVAPWGELVPPRQQARVVWGAVMSEIQNNAVVKYKKNKKIRILCTSY